MLRRFGTWVFDPDKVSCIDLAGHWVILQDGRHLKLDDAGMAALEAWLAEQDGERQYDEVMERMATEREQRYTLTTWHPAPTDDDAGTGVLDWIAANSPLLPDYTISITHSGNAGTAT